MKGNERYTSRTSMDGYVDTGIVQGRTVGECICQLADYEDTGYTPQEIKEQIEQRVRASWITNDKNVCSNCNRLSRYPERYCGFCGAEMGTSACDVVPDGNKVLPYKSADAIFSKYVKGMEDADE